MTTLAIGDSDVFAVFDDQSSDVAEPIREYTKVNTEKLYMDNINLAYDRLNRDRKRLCDVQVSLNVTQAAYDDCKRDAIIGGHVIGKNEAEREARLADLLRVQINQLRDAQRTERIARLYYEIAFDEVQRLKLLVQVMKELN